jgi:hypothetical protein
MAYKDGTGIGVVLSMGGTTPTVIGNVVSIGSGPGIKVDVREKTTLDDEWVRKVAGRLNGGDVSFEVELDPSATDHKLLFATAKARQVKDWTLAFPAPWTVTWEFSGILSDVSTSVDDDGPTASITIAVTGEPDFAETP